MKETIEVVIESQSYEAKQAQDKLLSLANIGEDAFFDMCDLLNEARSKGYYSLLGYPSFEMWVQSQNIDVTGRTANYYATVSAKAQELGIDRGTLKTVKISKLREIFSLNPQEHTNEMLELLAVAPAMTIDEVKQKVKAIKAGALYEEMAYMTIKVPVSVKPIIEAAFEQARILESAELSAGEALEKIVVEWTQEQGIVNVQQESTSLSEEAVS